MSEYYLIVVVLLFGLAIVDLIVGVSNDAVNFLNSAVGSKVASRRVIMIVASVGIFIGATFSSGMMEVARSGIFNPQFFSFDEVMVIFLAVMLTDIILLDMFNTFGMPTSTTVSIVFELLGAAVILSVIKVVGNGGSFADLSDYINHTKAVAIISGIFLSVLVAFTVGAIVQFFSRLLFSFDFESRSKWIGALWCGVSAAALTYFLVFKGVKGASFVTDEFIYWVHANTWTLFLVSIVFWSLLMFVLGRVGVNIYRIIVLFGTFSLAMAFAGNDLVNFIGVPIAGFESFMIWSADNESPSEMLMETLAAPVRTNSLLLVAAGAIMIITLWFSKKAQSVTETEVNLGRQQEGYERFSPNIISRWLVRQSQRLASSTGRSLPQSWIDKAELSFSDTSNHKGMASFDLIRASVNLTVASILVASATSLKLPLSTTYVSFMVAMGSSLADRAWGRDSAVFRVAGVINVIGGWLGTALIAFTASGVFAALIYFFRLPATILLFVAAMFLIYRTFRYHRKKEERKKEREDVQISVNEMDLQSLLARISNRIILILESVLKAYQYSLDGIRNEDREALQEAKRLIELLNSKTEDFRYEVLRSIKLVEEQEIEGSRTLILAYDLEQDIIQSTTLIVDICHEYVENTHASLLEKQKEAIEVMGHNTTQFFETIFNFLKQTPGEKIKPIKASKKQLYSDIESLLSYQVKGLKSEQLGMRNSVLVFSILMETKDIAAVSVRFVKLLSSYHKIQLEF